MLTQSLNKVLLLSFAHRSSQLHPVITLGARPFDPKYPSHTITKSYLSNIPCSRNHSITSAYCPWHTQSPIASFYCPLHTQSLHHILLSSYTRTITPFLPQITYTHNHPIISFKHPMLTQSLNHIRLLSFAYRSSLSHPVITLGARPYDPKPQIPFTHNH